MNKKPRILLYDIETRPNIGYTWAKYEQNVIEFVEEWSMLSFAWKWLGESKVYCFALPEAKTEKALVRKLWGLHDEADIVIAHNGNSFDNKKSNARFLALGMEPPSPYQSIDTKLVARRYFNFNSNSLDDLGNTLGVGRKLKHSGFDMWKGCMAGEKKAWKEMIKYNKLDVQLLERVYMRLRPWMTNHPNISQLSGDKPDACPLCSSTRLKSYGLRYTKTQAYTRYRCTDCKGFSRSRKAEELVKPRVVNL